MQHIMIDLEMNKIEKQWRGKNKLSSELIEIGAVRMDDSFAVVDTYQSYVKPEFGPMDAVIIDLTGITDDKVKDAPGFFEAMDDFAAWIGPEETQFYSWSMSDIRQFQHEALFKSYPGEIIQRMESHWTDFQEEFRRLDQAVLCGVCRRLRVSGGTAYSFGGCCQYSRDPEIIQGSGAFPDGYEAGVRSGQPGAAGADADGYVS